MATLIDMLDRASIKHELTIHGAYGPLDRCVQGVRLLEAGSEGLGGYVSLFWFDAEGRLLGTGAST